jgi:hypothetical protein
MTPTTFFLDPEHEKAPAPGSHAFRQRYCERRKIKSLHEQLPYVGYMTLPVVLALGMVYLGVFHSPPPHPNHPPPDPTFPWVIGTVVPAACLVMVLVTVLNVLSERRRYRLAWEGKLVTGRIETCTGTEYVTTSADNPLDSRPYTRVHVEYSVEAPSGRRVRGNATINRYDLRQEQLPAAGTPVCVLMLDGKKYEML